MTIDLDEIKAGDHVVLRDSADNTIEGEVTFDGKQLAVTAFNTKVAFAHVTRGGKLTADRGIKITGHWPPILTKTGELR